MSTERELGALTERIAAVERGQEALLRGIERIEERQEQNRDAGKREHAALRDHVSAEVGRVADRVRALELAQARGAGAAAERDRTQDNAHRHRGHELARQAIRGTLIAAAIGALLLAAAAPYFEHLAQTGAP